MSLEQSIQNLADAINRLANMAGAGAAVTALSTVAKIEADRETPAAEQPAKRGPGRPRKSESSAPADASFAASEQAEAEVAAPAAAVAPPAAPAAAPSRPASPMAAKSVSKDEVAKALIAVVQSGPEGRAKCSELCRKHGAPNLSGIAPTSYAALLADAQAAIGE